MAPATHRLARAGVTQAGLLRIAPSSSVTIIAPAMGLVSKGNVLARTDSAATTAASFLASIRVQATVLATTELAPATTFGSARTALYTPATSSNALRIAQGVEHA